MSRPDKIISFIRRHYTEEGKPPSVAVICKNTNLSFREFYESFRGVAEALKAAGVPVAEQNIEATRRANEARRAGIAVPQKGAGWIKDSILEIKINSPHRVPENQEVESSPMMVEAMKEFILSDAIRNFHSDMESSERRIDHLKLDVKRRIDAGEQTEGEFLEQYRKMGLRGENLDEVFRDMLRRERARNKEIQMIFLKDLPDLRDRFEQFAI